MSTRAEFYRIRRLQQQRKSNFRKRFVLTFLGVIIVISGVLVSVQMPSLLHPFDSTLMAQGLEDGGARERANATGARESKAGAIGATGATGATGSKTSPDVTQKNQVHSGVPIPLLINKANPLPSNITDGRIVDLTGVVPVVDNTMRVDKSLVSPLVDLFAAARKSGMSDFYVNSAYRTWQEQKEIYQSAEDKSYAQKPGHSEHQAGLAVDLAVVEQSGDNMGQSTSGQWLAAHSWEYGFILRYPADKVVITGIAYEPWHFRYVGREIAKYCYEEELCLEEYVAKASGN
jgi:LAS superfamily LD-carboxypeptidase LdcB